MPFDCNVMTSSCHVQLSWSFDGAVDFSPPETFLCHIASDGLTTMISMNPQQFFFSIFSLSHPQFFVFWCENKNNEKSEPEIPWAVIHTDVDGIACETFLLLCFGASVGSWLLIAKLKETKNEPKAKNKAQAANEIQRINKYNCFLSDGTHLNLFSGLMSWLVSKNAFLSLFS